MYKEKKIAVIIPAYNEESHIGKTIQSIVDCELMVDEVIVINNDSSDSTPYIAKRKGANVIDITGGPIGRLRNIGVEHSEADILIFLDADVIITALWDFNIKATLDDLLNQPLNIYGSHCSPPEGSSNWFEKYWFSCFDDFSSSHIGSAHMILSRELFLNVGGFSTELVTGEDYELCQKIIKYGGRVVENKQLKVIHHDFPKTIRSFISREIWHGEGDTLNIKAILNSRVALVALIFILLHILIFFGVITQKFTISLISIASIFSLTLGVSIIKFKAYGMKFILINTFIYYLYFWGRSLALVKKLHHHILKLAT